MSYPLPFDDWNEEEWNEEELFVHDCMEEAIFSAVKWFSLFTFSVGPFQAAMATHDAANQNKPGIINGLRLEA